MNFYKCNGGNMLLDCSGHDYIINRKTGYHKIKRRVRRRDNVESTHNGDYPILGLHPSTYILTSDGPKTVEDIYLHNGGIASIWIENDFIKSKIYRFTYNEFINIYLSNGYTIKCMDCTIIAGVDGNVEVGYLKRGDILRDCILPKLSVEDININKNTIVSNFLEYIKGIEINNFTSYVFDCKYEDVMLCGRILESLGVKNKIIKQDIGYKIILNNVKHVYVENVDKAYRITNDLKFFNDKCEIYGITNYNVK